jgi:ADP-ribose diphosphatase
MKLREDDQGEAFVQMNQDAIMVVALNSREEVLLIQEKSIAYGSPALTAPTGGVEPREKPEQTANRELQEEVGYVARRMDYITTLNPAVKYLRWKCHLYLARDLVYQPVKGDETSSIRVMRVPLIELNSLIASRHVTDSTTVAALCLVQQQINQEKTLEHLHIGYLHHQ